MLPSICGARHCSIRLETIDSSNLEAQVRLRKFFSLKQYSIFSKIRLELKNLEEIGKP